VLSPLANLTRHAHLRSASIALVTPCRSYSFAELLSAVNGVAAGLIELGIQADDLVAVDLPAAQEWIVDLALFSLAARTVSLRGVANPGHLPLDILITEPNRVAASSRRLAEVDEQWIDGCAVGAAEIQYCEFGGTSAIFRYILTSGTTGMPRAAAYSVGAFDYRMETGHLHWTDGRPELTMIGLSTTGGFHAAAACLKYGIAYLAIDRIDEESMKLAAEQQIEVLCGSPAQIAVGLQIILSADIDLPSLREVRLAGAGPSELLLKAIVDRVHVPVIGVYGSTEGGGICSLQLSLEGDRFAVGLPLPDVELEILDDSGEPVAAGIQGLVRYRTPGLVSGYFVDGIIQPLADGWFIPGDLGTVGTDGRLVLGGRDSELFNLGGVKLDPVRVDELAAAFAGVLEAAAFPVEVQAGILEIGLAVVADPTCDLRTLDRELRAKLPVGHPTVFWQRDGIPRSRIGKPDRLTLADEYDRLFVQSLPPQ
jgi:long-chain acyl-CoA synthetase